MEQKDDIYQIHILDEHGKTQRKYIFSGVHEQSFSDESIETIHVSQQIHPDDSVRVIKNKIIHAIGENNVSYNEIYMFIRVIKSIDVLDFYQTITQQDKIEFTKEHVMQSLRNMNYDESIIRSIEKNPKKNYFYDDLVEYVDPEKNTLKIPLGQKFSKRHDPMFSADPFDYQPGTFVHSPKNYLYASDNLLLLNYGKPIDNIIHVCFAEDVLEYQKNQNELSIIKTYFPLLFEENEIKDKDALLREKQNIIKQSKSRISKDAFALYKSVDFFYDVFKQRTADLAYSERGITYYSLWMKTNLNTRLPLEIVFKNIHSTKTVPFIKYNPGQMRENVYRLYSEKISRNGKKIPFLPETQLMQLSRKIGKKNQISMYIDNEIVVDFESNGDIKIHGELKKPLLPDELSKLISTSVNPIIDSINEFLNKSGYTIRKFSDIYDDDIEVLEMKYIASMVIDNEIALQKYMKCLHGIFTIYDSKISNPAKLAYKRVQNFHTMDAQHMYIKSIYKATEDPSVIIRSIMEQFQISQNEAQKQFAEYLENMNDYSTQNPGFQTIIRSEPLENKIIVEVNNIIHIQYVPIIHMYIDSLLRITQNPESTTVSKESIREMCKISEKMEKDVDVSHLQNEIHVLPEIEEEEEEKLFLEEIEEEELQEENIYDVIDNIEQDILEESEALFYEDDEEGDELFKGGSKQQDEYKMELAGTSLHNPNLFEERMKKREPYLFVTKNGKFTNYSTLCQSSAKKQPVILTQEEKDKIDKKDGSVGSKSYEHAIKFGTDPAKPHWYICPRYWCLQTNMSMTEEEVKQGKCGTKPYPHNIIPDGADVVPEGAYVIEFKSGKHVNKDGSYKYYNPGVLSRKTDDGHCLPCCYGEWKSGLWQKNKEKCPIQIEDDDNKDAEVVVKRRRKNQTKKQENYVMGIDKFPIGQARWGLLPFSVQSFLQTDNSVCISKTNQVVAEKENCFLRYGVEKSDNQSFLACMASMYAYKQELDAIPSLSEFKEILSKVVTLDMFIGYYNASLVSIFKPQKIYREKIDLDKYSATKFMDTINMEDEMQVDFLEDTIASFENFIEFIKSDTATIDHNYLWDMATQNHPSIMNGGYNLVILEIQKDDIRDNMQILCPSHSQSNVLYDPTKETVILIMQTNKQGTYFEPVYIYSDESEDVQRAFTEQTSPDNLKNILSIIQKTTNKYCAPLPSMPKKYHFKKNKNAQEILNILKEYNYDVSVQVLNYQGNIIGFYVKNETNDENVYVPCYPSTELPLLDKWWVDDDDLAHSYEDTRNRLTSIHMTTEGKVLCSPRFKVLEEGMIVGIVTETNQFVPISPISENIFQDGLLEIDSHNYIIADKVISTSHDSDPLRIEMVRKIELETQYYSLFRSIVRKELHEYNNKNIRKEIIKNMDDHLLMAREKLNNIIVQLRKLLNGKVQFSKIDKKILKDLMKCVGQECITIFKKEETVFPDKHLLSGVDNENIYFARVADELLRYRRVQLFMLNPKSYLNIGYSEYSIFTNEMLMLQSLLAHEYFEDLIVFNENDYLKQMDYNNAVPSISQSYTNQPITIEEQQKIMSIEKKPGELNIDCVQKIRDEVQGNDRSMWKRIFPRPAKEIVFHDTPYCSIYMMIYIIENVNKTRKGKMNVNITVSNIKSLLWGAYKEILDENATHYDKIVSILKMQGKRKLFSGNSSLEQIIASEGYYLTDLDIWIISRKLRLPIILFSSTNLKSLMDPTKKIDWLLLGGNVQKDKYFFVRSPASNSEYQLIIPETELTNPSLNEFYSILQKAIIQGKSDNTKDLQEYLSEYKFKTIAVKK
jgi:RNAse (barnase) inhibitor barstar